MAATALEIIEDALLDLGAKDPLVPLTAQEAAHGLRTLNNLMELWRCNRLLAPSQDRIGPLAVVSGTTTYQFGAGGAWSSAARPIAIESAFVRDGGHDWPLELYTAERYALVTDKSFAALPIALYYEASIPAFGHLYPTPNSAAYQVYLMVRDENVQFASTASAVNLPPGFMRALKLNLAVALAPSRQKPVPEMLMRSAMEAKESIAMINRQVGPIQDELGRLGSTGRRYSSYGRFFSGV